MPEIVRQSTQGAGAVAIVLVLILVGEHLLIGLMRRAVTRQRKRALVAVIVPLVPVFVTVVVVRMIDIAATHS